MRPRSGRSDFLTSTLLSPLSLYHTVGALSLLDDDTETTNALYQDYYANMYALGFRLVVS